MIVYLAIIVTLTLICNTSTAKKNTASNARTNSDRTNSGSNSRNKVTQLNDECDLVLYYLESYGLGVYAGKLFKPDSLIEEIVGLITHKATTSWTELEHYIDAYNDTHDIVYFGYSMIYNHAPIHEGQMIKKIKIDETMMKLPVPKAFQPVIHRGFKAAWTIFPGDQIFNYYGHDWFAQRGEVELPPREQLDRRVTHIDNIHAMVNSSNHLGEIDGYRLPGCSTLMTRYKDGKLFANRDIRKGEYIEVSRAILIQEFYQRARPTPLAYYLWNKHLNATRIMQGSVINLKQDPKYDPGKQYAMLLLGRGAFYGGYSSSDTTRKAAINVYYDWYDPSKTVDGITFMNKSSVSSYMKSDGDRMISETTSDLYGMSAEDFYEDVIEDVVVAPRSGRYTHNNIRCSTTMFVAFIAKRDISKDEELVIELVIDKRNNRREVLSSFGLQCL